MPVPSLSLRSSPLLSAEAEVIVLGVISTDDGPRLASPDPAFAPIHDSLRDIGATGAPDELRRLPSLAPGAPAIALIGLGSLPKGVDRPTPDALRDAAGAAVRQLAGIASLALGLPATDAPAMAAVLEGAGIAAYAYTDQRVASLDGQKRPVTHVAAHVAELPAEAEALVARATAVATAVHRVRDLVNTPPNELYPATFAERALALAEGRPVEVEILDESALADGGFGGILGVGQGSSRPPRLVILRYTPEHTNGHLALVGKGITFDSGGLSLKPPASMVGMKYDMTGAATALAVTLAAAEIGVATSITTFLCLAENLPSGSAIRPNDVLRIRDGRTVEVLNTDAEGRIVMADGIAAASEAGPDAIVDIATLTGAARVAMGERIVPVMGDEALSRRLVELGEIVGEKLWPMPIPSELRAVLDSEVADIANARPGNTAAAMLLAARFLQEFVGSVGDRRIPWAHLDIAGTANNSGAAHGATAKGPTGVTVRTLLALTEVFSRP